ncbi:hypothetical protein BH23THE1_BH23THE1_16870 [soil metagenome]
MIPVKVAVAITAVAMKIVMNKMIVTVVEVMTTVEVKTNIVIKTQLFPLYSQIFFHHYILIGKFKTSVLNYS